MTNSSPNDRPNLDMKVRDIVARWPEAARTLTRLDLDMCCGGAHPLRMAAQAHGLDPDAVLAELLAAFERP